MQVIQSSTGACRVLGLAIPVDIADLVLQGSAAFLVSLVLSFAFVPFARSMAVRLDVMDRPDGHLKRQPLPVPYLGGVAVYAALVSTLLPIMHDGLCNWVIGAAATAIVALGLVDDVRPIQPLTKLMGECVIVLLLIGAGLRFEIRPWWTWLNVAFTFAWLIVVVNAINIIDVLDGLAGGVAAIACGWLMVAACIQRDAAGVSTMAALAGALFGFLKYNKIPASIYLGDAGSLLLGLLLGVQTIRTSRGDGVACLIGVALVLSVPIFDVAFVAYARWSRKLSVLRGSPDHFPYQLARLGFSQLQVLWLTYGVALILGGLGVLCMVLPSSTAVALAGFAVSIAWLAAVWLKRSSRDGALVRPSERRLQGG